MAIAGYFFDWPCIATTLYGNFFNENFDDQTAIHRGAKRTEEELFVFVSKEYPLANKQLDPQRLMETNLLTPIWQGLC